MINGLGESMMIVWAQLGVIIENQEETTESLTMWISVPKSSYHTDVNGDEMSGMFLAKRLKEKLVGMGVRRLTMKARVRNEAWTKEMGDKAVLDVKKMLYRSQW